MLSDEDKQRIREEEAYRAQLRAKVEPIGDVRRVIVTDIHMEFGSMVIFLIKLSMAAIPAAIVVGLIWLVLLALLRGL